MPSLFPGMDPYLEAPRYWEEFHTWLIFYLGDALQDRMPAGYVARFE